MTVGDFSQYSQLRNTCSQLVSYDNNAVTEIAAYKLTKFSEYVN